MKWYGGMVQPEVAFLSMFQTSDNDPFTCQNTKNFIINILMLTFIIFTIKFAFNEVIPSVLQVVGIFVMSLFATITMFVFVRFFNRNIITNKVKGLFSSIFYLILFIITIGVFM